MYGTIDDALLALEHAEQDVLTDFGEDEVEAAWGDLVRSVAALCTPDVAAELIRRELSL